LEPVVRAWRPQEAWVEWGGLAVASYAFAVLFRAHRSDYLKVMASAAAGYLISRFVGLAWGSPAGIFLAALIMTAIGNAYARWGNRPGAIIRVPGIILLVPGSVSLRGLLTMIQQQDVNVGQDAILAVINILLALIAGLIFGNLLLPSRRNL
ncbi:threonine/serine exporter family protein, partial [Lysobacter sp. 2RAB21]